MFLRHKLLLVLLLVLSGFHTVQWISWLAEYLLKSQEGPSFMESVSRQEPPHTHRATAIHQTAQIYHSTKGWHNQKKDILHFSTYKIHRTKNFSDFRHWATDQQQQRKTHSELYKPELQNRTRTTRQIKVWYMRYNDRIEQINRELGSHVTHTVEWQIFECFDYERNSLYDFLNTPQTSEPGHSWDIHSVRINNEKVIVLEHNSLCAIVFVFNSEDL